MWRAHERTSSRTVLLTPRGLGVREYFTDGPAGLGSDGGGFFVFRLYAAPGNLYRHVIAVEVNGAGDAFCRPARECLGAHAERTRLVAHQDCNGIRHAHISECAECVRGTAL